VRLKTNKKLSRQKNMNRLENYVTLLKTSEPIIPVKVIITYQIITTMKYTNWPLGNVVWPKLCHVWRVLAVPKQKQSCPIFETRGKPGATLD